MKLDRTVVKGLTYFLFISILMSPFIPPVALLIIGIATLLTYKGRWSLRFPEGIFIGFIVVTMISWYFNPSYFFGIPIGLIPVIVFALLYLLSIWVRYGMQWSWKEIQKAYLFFWLGGLYVALIVVLQQMNWSFINESWLGYLFRFYHEYRWQSEWSVRSVGTSGNSNITAAMLICFAMMSIYAASVLKKAWQKGLAFGVFGIYCYAIASTGSRGAWVGLVIGLIVQLWMTGHRVRTVVITLSLGVLAFIYPEMIPRNDTMAITLAGRLKIWIVSLDIFKEHWLVGSLPLHFGQIYAHKTGTYLYHAHNIFLGMASEYGILGLGLFFTLILVTIQRARKWRKKANHKEEKRLAGVLLSQTIALLGHGMYDYPILSPQVGLIFMLSILFIHTQYERRCLSDPKWGRSP